MTPNASAIKVPSQWEMACVPTRTALVAGVTALLTIAVATVNILINTISAGLMAALRIIIASLKAIIKSAIALLKAGLLWILAQIINNTLGKIGPDWTIGDVVATIDKLEKEYGPARDAVCEALFRCRPILKYLIPDNYECLNDTMHRLLVPAANYYAEQTYGYDIPVQGPPGSLPITDDRIWSAFKNDIISNKATWSTFLCRSSLKQLLMGLFDALFTYKLEDIFGAVNALDTLISERIARLKRLLDMLKSVWVNFYQKALVLTPGQYYLVPCKDTKWTIQQGLDYLQSWGFCLCGDANAEIEKVFGMLKLEKPTKNSETGIYEVNLSTASFTFEKTALTYISETEQLLKDGISGINKDITDYSKRMRKQALAVSEL